MESTPIRVVLAIQENENADEPAVVDVDKKAPLEPRDELGFVVDP